MGTKYATVALSGYNSSPPPDDGTQTASNLVTWAGQKSKLTDPIKTQVAAIDAALVLALNTSSRAVTATDSVLASDHLKTLQCSGTFTESLLDASTAGAGFQVYIKNVGTGVITVDRTTATDTIDAVSSAVTLYTLESALFVVNAAANGYNRLVGGSTPDTSPIVHGATDKTKRVRIEVDGLTAGQTRTITMPDEDVTLAAATTSARGTVQLATTAEVQTGTDAAKAVTVAALQNGKAVNGTPQLTTSGTAFDFTIPSWAKQVTLTLTDVSLSGTDNLLVQLGDAGGIENTNYVGCAISANNTSILGTTSLSSGFIIGAGGGGASISGAVTLNLHNPATFTWAATGVCGNSAGSVVTWFGGYKATSQAMTTVRLTRTGTDTFDAGGVNVLYT